MRKAAGKRVYARLIGTTLTILLLVSTSPTASVSTATAALPVRVAGHPSGILDAATRTANLPSDQALNLTVALRPRSAPAIEEAAAVAKTRANQP